MDVVELGLIFAISAPFALAVWMTFHEWADNQAVEPDVIVDRAFWPGRFSAETLDVEQEVRAAADSAADLARAHSVRVRLAVARSTTARVNPIALRTALRAVIEQSIRVAAGGEVLITAALLGSQVHIRVTDDRADADQKSREAGTREASSLIALQGGSIAIEAILGRGTTVSIRLPLRGRTDEARNDYVKETTLADHTA
jgi:hypothetical protein